MVYAPDSKSDELNAHVGSTPTSGIKLVGQQKRWQGLSLLLLAMILTLTAEQVTQLFAHAQAVAPEECCGLLGGKAGQVTRVYSLPNVAADAQRAYETAPADLFAAQKTMRERGEKLLGIYHSHPGQIEPQPSATDVRLAFYPTAVYFIIGLGDAQPILRAFYLDADATSCERIEYVVKAE